MASSTNGRAAPIGDAKRTWLRPARMAVATDLLLTAVLAIFLSIATHSRGDAIPRPLVIAVLFATPGVIGLLGVIGERRSLLGAAALPLIPGSVLSFALVTLVFVIPALLFMVAMAAMPASSRPLSERLIGAGRTLVVGGLVIAAGFAGLIGMTVEGCYSTATVSGCGSGLTSWAGVATGALLLLVAIAIAAWTVRDRIRGPLGDRPA
jgi:hypothetical protein